MGQRKKREGDSGAASVHRDTSAESVQNWPCFVLGFEFLLSGLSFHIWVGWAGFFRKVTLSLLIFRTLAKMPAQWSPHAQSEAAGARGHVRGVTGCVLRRARASGPASQTLADGGDGFAKEQKRIL